MVKLKIFNFYFDVFFYFNRMIWSSKTLTICFSETICSNGAGPAGKKKRPSIPGQRSVARAAPSRPRSGGIRSYGHCRWSPHEPMQARNHMAQDCWTGPLGRTREEWRPILTHALFLFPISSEIMAFSE